MAMKERPKDLISQLIGFISGAKRKFILSSDETAMWEGMPDFLVTL